MSKGKWVLAEEDRAKACETAFQNGGPRVYVYNEWRQRPSSDSATAAIRLKMDNEVVYARRKHGQQWLWKKWVLNVEVAA